MSIPRLRPHSLGLLDILRDTGLPVEQGFPPDGSGWQGSPGQSAFKGYLVLHSVPGGVLDGPLGCPDDDLSGLWQVTAVGMDAEQCEELADKAHTALLDLPVTVDGRAVVRVAVEVLSGARPDLTVKPPVWISTDLFRVTSTPS